MGGTRYRTLIFDIVGSAYIIYIYVIRGTEYHTVRVSYGNIARRVCHCCSRFNFNKDTVLQLFEIKLASFWRFCTFPSLYLLPSCSHSLSFFLFSILLQFLLRFVAAKMIFDPKCLCVGNREMRKQFGWQVQEIFEFREVELN